MVFMTEKSIRIHGRGGQGAVTFSQILAVALNYCDKYCQAFPSFGPERGGAPVEAFIRISDKKIDIRSQVYDPDIVIVLDSSLLKTVDITYGLKKRGILIINSNEPEDRLEIKNKNNYEIHAIDASSIAIKIFNKDIVNTAMMGALSKITGIVSLESVSEGIEQRFEGNKDLIELNKRAIKEVYEKSGNLK